MAGSASLLGLVTKADFAAALRVELWIIGAIVFMIAVKIYGI